VINAARNLAQEDPQLDREFGDNSSQRPQHGRMLSTIAYGNIVEF